MNGHATTCKCGHDIDTHHKEPAANGGTISRDCLARNCECRYYWNEHRPEDQANYSWRTRAHDVSRDVAEFYKQKQKEKKAPNLSW